MEEELFKSVRDDLRPTQEWGNFLLNIGLYFYAIFACFSISASQISLGLAFIGLLRLIYIGKTSPKSSTLDRPFACFVLAGAFSLANANDLWRAVVEMKKFLIILLFWLPFWIRVEKSLQRRILGLFLFFGSVSMVISVLKMLYFAEGMARLRAYGFFSLPITFGEIQGMLAILALGWLSAGESNPRVRVYVIVAFFFLLGGMLMSFTRGAWLGFAMAFLILFAQRPKRFFPMVFALIFIIIISVLTSSSFAQRFQRFDFQSNFFRFRIWQIGFDILQTSPVFGVGMNNVKALYKDRVEAFDIINKEVHGHLHSNFMQILTMTGYFGFTIFFWFLSETGRFCLVAHKKITDPWQKRISRQSIAILIFFLGTGLTEYSYGDEEVSMLAFFLLGILVSPYFDEGFDGKGNNIPIAVT